MKLSLSTAIGSLICSGILAGALISAPVALADKHAMQDGEYSEERAAKYEKFAKKRAKRIKKKLALSDEQAAQMQQMHVDQKAAVKPIYEAIREAKKGLKALVQAEEYDATAVERLAAEKAQLGQQMTILRSAHQFEIRSILNEEQREKFDQMHSEGKRGFHKRRHQKREDSNQ